MTTETAALAYLAWLLDRMMSKLIPCDSSWRHDYGERQQYVMEVRDADARIERLQGRVIVG